MNTFQSAQPDLGSCGGSNGRARRERRRGGVTLWTLITIPAILVLFCFVIEIAHLWHAKVKLKNAVEAGVLAATKTWGDNGGGGGGSMATAAIVGEDYAEANSIDGIPVTDVDPGDFVFGSVTPISGNTSYTFSAGATTSGTLAVRIAKTVTVSSFCQQVFGINIANYDVSAEVAALYDATSTPRKARLIWLTP